MNKTRIKEMVVSSHKFVVAHADDFESWEWENTVLDNLQVMLAKTWKKDWKQYFFLRGFKDYLNGCFDWQYICYRVFDYSEDYRNGLQAASELCEELKYFDEAFGKDSYSLTI